MATASDILSAIAPAFDASANRSLFLELAELRTSSTHYGDNRTQAVALRAAHLLALNAAANGSDGVSGGPVASKSEGDLSVTYAVSSDAMADGDLNSTAYGRQLIAIRRSSGTGIQVTGLPFVRGAY